MHLRAKILAPSRSYCTCSPNIIYIYSPGTSQSLISSFLGLLSILYNIWSSHNYVWGPASLAGTVIAITSVLIYTTLLLWEGRRRYISRRTREYVHASGESVDQFCALVQCDQQRTDRICEHVQPSGEGVDLFCALVQRDEQPEDDKSFNVEVPEVDE
jgi:hypothetical protein